MLLHRLKEVSGPDRRALLLNQIGSRVREILQWDSSEPFRSQQKLFELGLKSLDLIELKNRLESDLAVELPVTLFFSYSTLGGLTEYLLSEVLRFDADGSKGRNTSEPDRVESSAAEIELPARPEELSEEDAERALLERISDLERRLK